MSENYDQATKAAMQSEAWYLSVNDFSNEDILNILVKKFDIPFNISMTVEMVDALIKAEDVHYYFASCWRNSEDRAKFEEEAVIADADGCIERSELGQEILDDCEAILNRDIQQGEEIILDDCGNVLSNVMETTAEVNVHMDKIKLMMADGVSEKKIYEYLRAVTKNYDDSWQW